MDKPKDSETATPEIKPAEPAAPATLDAIETGSPKVGAAAEPAAIELPRLTLPKMDLSKLESLKLHSAASERPKDAPAAGDAPAVKPEAPRANPEFETAAAAAAASQPPRASRRYALAASVALAILLGIGAGGAATHYFSKTEPVANRAADASDETRKLRETVVRLSSDLATLQARIDTSTRNTASQLGKLNDRLERANAEPAAKLAKIADSLDRLERKVAAADPDVTGSVTAVAKSESKPTEIAGWKLVEFFGGRALVENRGGDMYEVGPGSSLPGVGRVESIKRQDGKIVVLTAKGQISGTPAPPRRAPPPQRYMHYRY